MTDFARGIPHDVKIYKTLLHLLYFFMLSSYTVETSCNFLNFLHLEIPKRVYSFNFWTFTLTSTAH